MAVTLTISTSQKRLKGTTIEVESLEKTTVADLRKTLAKRYKLAPTSVRITRSSAVGKEPLVYLERSLAQYGVKANDELQVKNIGIQMNWRTVYCIEYLGPLIFHPLVFFGQETIYGRQSHYSLVQKSGFALIMLHFLKRELETLFLHRFSADTMPIFNLFLNSSYYWFVSGLFAALTFYHPAHDVLANYYGFKVSDTAVYGLIGLWTLCQLGNFHAHYTMAHLRPAGSREHFIPRGGLFEFVSVPNYTYEWAGWVVLSILTRDPSVIIFTLITTVVLSRWSMARHRRYRKEFKDYPRQRKAFIPFVY